MYALQSFFPSISVGNNCFNCGSVISRLDTALSVAVSPTISDSFTLYWVFYNDFVMIHSPIQEGNYQLFYINYFLSFLVK